MPTLSLMPFEREVVACTSRFMGIFAGRGAGKTHAIQSRMKWLCTRNPRFRYMYITPLSVQGDEVYEEMIGDHAFRQFVRSIRSRPYPKIKLKNKSQIWFRSWQRPDNVRSTGEDEICFDESQDPSCGERGVNMVVQPMLSRRPGINGRRGTLLIAGQFRGDDWRYRKYFVPGTEFIDGKPNPKCQRPLYTSWQIPSSEGYAYKILPGGPEELALQRSVCPTQEIWEQEWECKPLSNANAYFRPVHIDAVSVGRYPLIKQEMAPVRGGGYCVCIDLGGIYDPVALIVGHSSGDVVFEKTWPLGLDDQQYAHEAMEIARFFNALVVVDSTGGGKPGVSDPDDKRVEFYRKAASIAGLEFQDVYQGKNKERLLSNLRVAIQQKEIGIAPELKETIEQLKAYECIYNARLKLYKFGAPQGKHDDFVSCLLCFVECLARNWIQRTAGGRGLRFN